MEEKKQPKYEFIVKEGDELVNPFKRTVAKTMEVTENFTPFDAMKYVAKMKKAIEDKQAEIKGLEEMVNAYEEELKVIDDILHLNSLETEFLKEEVKRSEQMAQEVKQKEVESLVQEIVNEEQND